MKAYEHLPGPMLALGDACVFPRLSIQARSHPKSWHTRQDDLRTMYYIRARNAPVKLLG